MVKCPHMVHKTLALGLFFGPLNKKKVFVNGVYNKKLQCPPRIEELVEIKEKAQIMEQDEEKPC